MQAASLLLLVCVSCALGWASDDMDCWRKNRNSTTKQVAGFVFRISRYHDKQENEDVCRAVVLDANKKVIFSAMDQAFSIVLAGEDVNGDGSADVVFEGYSGGAHCCWTYYIVSLGESPKLLAQFYNERGAAFVRNTGTGHMEIATLDGGFDYFDSLSHAETPFPSVYLRLDGRKLVDVSHEHVGDYDIEIEEAKRRLDAQALRKFRSVPSHRAFVSDTTNRRTSGLVLALALAFLYSGRSSQAHKTIEEMWPAFDQQRIWKLILKTKRDGILNQTGHRAS
jgi:hypothetical protein